MDDFEAATCATPCCCCGLPPPPPPPPPPPIPPSVSFSAAHATTTAPPRQAARTFSAAGPPCPACSCAWLLPQTRCSRSGRRLRSRTCQVGQSQKVHWGQQPVRGSIPGFYIPNTPQYDMAHVCWIMPPQRTGAPAYASAPPHHSIAPPRPNHNLPPPTTNRQPTTHRPRPPPP